MLSRAVVPIAIASIALSACGTSQQKRELATPAEPSPLLTFKDVDGKIRLTLGPKGKLMKPSGAGGALLITERDGDLVALDGGRVRARLRADGSVVDAAGKPVTPGTISAAGAFTSGGTTATIDGAGKLTAKIKGVPTISIVGATTPAKKRKAMFIVILTFMVIDVES